VFGWLGAPTLLEIASSVAREDGRDNVGLGSGGGRGGPPKKGFVRGGKGWRYLCMFWEKSGAFQKEEGLRKKSSVDKKR